MTSQGESTPKPPLDPFPYNRDPHSCPATAALPNGLYAYVRHPSGVVFVVPDAPHVHPKIPGHAEPALYAGDMAVKGGRVADVTNLSGTFQFDDEAGLLAVAVQLESQGLDIAAGAVRLFPADGSRPRTLR
jgi:hypothetical protein